MSPFHHSGQERLRQNGHRTNMEIDHGEFVLLRRFREGAIQAKASVVDEYIDLDTLAV